MTSSEDHSGHYRLAYSYHRWNPRLATSPAPTRAIPWRVYCETLHEYYWPSLIVYPRAVPHGMALALRLSFTMSGQPGMTPRPRPVSTALRRLTHAPLQNMRETVDALSMNDPRLCPLPTARAGCVIWLCVSQCLTYWQGARWVTCVGVPNAYLCCLLGASMPIRPSPFGVAPRTH